MVHRFKPTNTVSVRFAVGWSDLEAVSPVLTLHGHDRTVVQIQNHPASHCAPRLAHQVPPLREEEQPVPRRGHQPRLTAGHRAQCVKPDTSPANYTKSDPDPRKVTRTSWCWGNRLSGWGRDSRGHDGGPACRQCHPRTGALSETSAWPLPRPLTETQCWSTDREREGITDNPHTRVCVLWNKDMFFTSDSCWKLSLENCPSSSTPAPSPS